MQFTKVSPTTGIELTRDLPITQDQFDHWQSGEYIQVALSNLSPSDREWLMTGMTQEDWDEMNADDDE